jgi:hypothetical protein
MSAGTRTFPAVARKASGRAPAVLGSQTGPGFIVYRFGADLFYANADRFAECVPLSTKRPNRFDGLSWTRTR